MPVRFPNPLSRRAALIAAALLALALAAACGSDPTPTPEPTPTQPSAPTATSAPAQPPAVGAAKDGDLVSAHYHGTLDDGRVFDSSRERDPLQFTVGAGSVIDGFDNAVRGLGVGESVTVRLEPEEAYGEPRPDLLIELPIENAPEGVAVGSVLTMPNGAQARVVALTDTTFTIDANHPLAGQALTFKIELVAIERAP